MRSAKLVPLRLLLLAVALAVVWAPDAPSAQVEAGAPATSAIRRALPPATQAMNTCAACHSTLTDDKLRKVAEDFAHSIHRDEGIGCVGCHGGDPRDPTTGAHAAALGFRAHPTHGEVAGMCGACHENVSFIRRFNGLLPVGQATLFATSLHGKLTAAGDARAPDCTTCHGKHDILDPASALSPVNRSNVAKLCGSCHADKDRMASYGIAVDQLPKWEKSVHGVAFAAGNPKAPTCTGCHSPHSSLPPDVSSLTRVCVRCHADEQLLFEQSPHSQEFRKRGLGPCVVCHGNHDVAPPTALMVGTQPNAVCMKCHANDEKPREVADRIAELLGGVELQAAEARAAVARAHDRGLHVAGADYALDRIATAEMKMRSAVHTLDPVRVAALVADADPAAREVVRLVGEAEHARLVERRGYDVALALAALLLLLLVLKARQLDRRRRQGSA